MNNKLTPNWVLLIDRFNTIIGKTIAFFTISMVIIQIIVVVLRYIFGFGSVFLQESILYLHAIVFLSGAGYALFLDAHVRVDVLYQKASERGKNIINILGGTILLLPFVIALFIYSWPYVVSSWQVLEGSRETTGIPAVFLLKTFILVYCVLLGLQAVSMITKGIINISKGESNDS